MATAIVVVGFAIAVLIIDIVTRLLAPHPDKDPRLGTAGFLAVVLVSAVAGRALAPYLDAADNLLSRLIFAVELLAWLAWKIGAGDDQGETERDREQSWAASVGFFIGFGAWLFRR
jgi:cobalamin synthase